MFGLKFNYVSEGVYKLSMTACSPNEGISFSVTSSLLYVETLSLAGNDSLIIFFSSLLSLFELVYLCRFWINYLVAIKIIELLNVLFAIGLL